MNYYATTNFLKMCKALPPDVQKQAQKRYDVLKGDPRHLSEHLKRVGNLWTAQINGDFRIIGTSVDGGILWFWVGARKKS